MRKGTVFLPGLRNSSDELEPTELKISANDLIRQRSRLNNTLLGETESFYVSYDGKVRDLNALVSLAELLDNVSQKKCHSRTAAEVDLNETRTICRSPVATFD
ncbi:hypothetical protein H4Q26_012334 [Puccinia striiformis f. sp. tritici PST-130]|nr:hypothetical protein H4Q26_012334 [Puccinia striiformis f. sp. tritici PST-130]